MALMIYLLSLVALLAGFLVWRRVPRRAAFDIVHLSAWIFTVTAFLSLHAADRVAPQLADGLVPFIPPVIPVGFFVLWSLRRVKERNNERRSREVTVHRGMKR